MMSEAEEPSASALPAALPLTLPKAPKVTRQPMTDADFGVLLFGAER